MSECYYNPLIAVKIVDGICFSYISTIELCDRCPYKPIGGVNVQGKSL